MTYVKSILTFQYSICCTFNKKIMGNLGFQEILLIAVVVLVLFGGKKIPEFMKGIGKGIREFNDVKDNVKKELEEGMKVKDNTTDPKA
jgi:sec-independent protein translocase protein TatA